MLKVSDVVLVSLLLNLNIFHTLFSVSIVDFEHVIAGWVRLNVIETQNIKCIHLL